MAAEELTFFEVAESTSYVVDIATAWEWFWWLPLEWRLIVGAGSFGVVVVAWIFLTATLPDRG